MGVSDLRNRLGEHRQDLLHFGVSLKIASAGQSAYDHRLCIDLHVVKDGDKYDITLSEKQVAAFAGQQIAANAGIANAQTAAKVATAVILAPLAPAAIASGGVGAAAAGAGAATLLTPSAPAVPPSGVKP